MHQSAAMPGPAATGQASAQRGPANPQNQVKAPLVPNQANIDALKEYAAGRNSRQQKLAVGLPILSDSRGTVQLVLECNNQVSLLAFVLLFSVAFPALLPVYQGTCNHIGVMAVSPVWPPPPSRTSKKGKTHVS